jgi:serine/threonine-protein kinase
MVSLTEGSAHLDSGLRELQPGSFLDRFRVERQLGAGGFGTVYLASHVILKSLFAIKVLKPAFNKKHSMLSRLQREGKLAAMISHENVVRVYDAVQHPDIAYLVMEYVENGSLSDLLKSERHLPVSDALRLGLGVTRGLAAGLQAGVIHRDIKPANVLLGRDGVKITDFGLALLKSRSAEASRVGTPGYASPEQTNQGVVDHRADIFSLGVTLFEAITGLGPRKLGNSTTKAAAPDVATVTARLGPIDQDVAQLVSSMIAPEPAKRLGSYEHIERRLLELLSRS